MAELRSFDPTWRDKIAAFLMGNERPSPARRTFVEGMMGSTGLGTTGMGLVDATPVGSVLGAQEAAKGGDYKGAAVQAMFLGPSARIADRAALSTAEKLAAKGASRDEIWNQTGWFKGVDDKWRFEVPDNAVPTKFIPTEDKLFEYPKVGEFMPHERLFTAYPELAETRMVPELKDFGHYDRAQNVVGVRPVDPGDFTPQAVRQRSSATLHELQHGVQDIEGFASGADPEAFARLKTPYPAQTFEVAQFVKDEAARAGVEPSKMLFQMQLKGNPIVDRVPNLDDALSLRPEMFDQFLQDARMAADPAKAYFRTAGEVEARNVQKRMDMTPEQRRATPPWLTQDVPDNQQIVRYLLGK